MGKLLYLKFGEKRTEKPENGSKPAAETEVQDLLDEIDALQQAIREAREELETLEYELSDEIDDREVPW